DPRPRENPGWIQNSPTFYTNLIARAPNLESLLLGFCEPDTDELYVSSGCLKSSEFFSKFSRAHFPKLQSFTTTLVSDCTDPFDFRDNSGLRRFIRVHPQLQKISVTQVQSMKHYFMTMPGVDMWSCRHITSNNISALMSSVRHFEGPSVICEALLGSPLAEQIESLGIIELNQKDLDLLPRLATGNVTLRAPTLPQLKRFQVIVDTAINYWHIVMTALTSVIVMMPNLEELIVQNAGLIEIQDSQLL
ncbi:hypothetical protein FRC11_007442, partial [Ceratobasidium sp. 423]